VSLIFLIILLSLILQLESSDDGFKGFSILIGQLFYAHLVVLGLNTLRYLCFVHPFFSGMTGLNRHHQPNWRKGLFLGQTEKWPAVLVSDCLVTLNLLFGLAVQEFLLWFEWQYSPLGLLLDMPGIFGDWSWMSQPWWELNGSNYPHCIQLCVCNMCQLLHAAVSSWNAVSVHYHYTFQWQNTCLTLQTTNF